MGNRSQGRGVTKSSLGLRTFLRRGRLKPFHARSFRHLHLPSTAHRVSTLQARPITSISLSPTDDRGLILPLINAVSPRFLLQSLPPSSISLPSDGRPSPPEICSSTHFSYLSSSWRRSAVGRPRSQRRLRFPRPRRPVPLRPPPTPQWQPRRPSLRRRPLPLKRPNPRRPPPAPSQTPPLPLQLLRRLPPLPGAPPRRGRLRTLQSLVTLPPPIRHQIWMLGPRRPHRQVPLRATRQARQAPRPGPPLAGSRRL